MLFLFEGRTVNVWKDIYRQRIHKEGFFSLGRIDNADIGVVFHL